jgi:uncharacterized protein YjbI with pentapeptide repeats
MKDSISWATCSNNGCTGVQLPAGGKCWAHAEDPHLDKALGQLAADGHLDARGVPVTDALLDRLLAAAPRGKDGHVVLAFANFRMATFGHTARFNHVNFQGNAYFYKATFEDDAWFSDATFQHDVNFSEVTFHDRAEFIRTAFRSSDPISGAAFDHTTFHGDAVFTAATFKNDSHFLGATFRQSARFDEATFQRHAWFGDATFDGSAWFSNANFYGQALLDSVTFREGVAFDGAIIRAPAVFTRASFEHTQPIIGPLLATGPLVLTEARFAQPVRIDAYTPRLYCDRVQFAEGAQLMLCGARVVLDDSSFPAPTILTALPRRDVGQLSDSEKRVALAWDQLRPEQVPDRPQILSLQRADVAGLTISGADLTDCRFAGAHNLDKLRIEADVTLAAAPAGLGQDRRQVIADERAWRAQTSSRWTAPWRPDWITEEPAIPEPGQIAGLYRALRKGREDDQDEPGAADFYYGEMEMRRHARQSRAKSGASFAGGVSRGRAERGILTIYWLVSGYGLRAWRALACLAGLLTVFALTFHLIGFSTPPQPASYLTSLLYAFRATVSLTDDDVKLTAWGKLLETLLRLTGPVLFGLALLALRNRVKR